MKHVEKMHVFLTKPDIYTTLANEVYPRP